jgi:hypothetical protein
MYGPHFEGDIILTEKQRAALQNSGRKSGRRLPNEDNLGTASSIDIEKWSNGIVPYTFAPGNFSIHNMILNLSYIE